MAERMARVVQGFLVSFKKLNLKMQVLTFNTHITKYSLI